MRSMKGMKKSNGWILDAGCWILDAGFWFAPLDGSTLVKNHSIKILNNLPADHGIIKLACQILIGRT